MPRRSARAGAAGVESDAKSGSGARPPLGCNFEAKRVDGVKIHRVQLCARDAELTAVIERATAEREVVRAEMVSVQDELDVLVNAPVSGGRDPTLWLPDELMEMIFPMEPFDVMWYRVCECVCQRWRRIAQQNSLAKRTKQLEGRWGAYEAALIMPRRLELGHSDTHLNIVLCLAEGLDGKIYTAGSLDYTIRVWAAHGMDGTYLEELKGHTDAVCVLTVGLDGKIYTGSWDKTIRVWSGVDGEHLHTLEGHTGFVCSLAVGPDGKIYSGSDDCTIRVWSGVDGTHLQTLEGPCRTVRVLAVGLDGKIYTGSLDDTIIVWSGVDGAHLQTLEGHTHPVSALAVGLDGKIYTGSWDHTIRV